MNPERSVWAVADGVATLFMGAAMQLDETGFVFGVDCNAHGDQDFEPVQSRAGKHVMRLFDMVRELGHRGARPVLHCVRIGSSGLVTGQFACELVGVQAQPFGCM